MSPSLLIERAAAIMVHPIDAAAAEMGLLPHEWRILVALHDAGPDGLPVSAIANACLALQPTMTKHLDQMWQALLVERQQSTEDRRVVIMRLTEAGATLAADIAQRAQAICDATIPETLLTRLSKVAQAWPADKTALPLVRVRR